MFAGFLYKPSLDFHIIIYNNVFKQSQKMRFWQKKRLLEINHFFVLDKAKPQGSLFSSKKAFYDIAVKQLTHQELKDRKTKDRTELLRSKNYRKSAFLYVPIFHTA